MRRVCGSVERRGTGIATPSSRRRVDGVEDKRADSGERADFDFHAGPERDPQVRDAVRAAGVPLLVWGKTVYNADGTARTLGSTTGGPAEPAPFD